EDPGAGKGACRPAPADARWTGPVRWAGGVRLRRGGETRAARYLRPAGASGGTAVRARACRAPHHEAKGLGRERSARGSGEFLAPPHRDAFRSYIERVGGGHKGSLEVEMAGLKGGARTVLVRAAPLEKPGRGATLLVMARDVTELRELEADLRESQKMAAVGQLAATFAHD